jgi:hypothetical protein
MGQQPALDHRVLWVEALSITKSTSSSAGTTLSMVTGARGTRPRRGPDVLATTILGAVAA